MLENIFNKLKMIDFLNLSQFFDSVYFPKIDILDILEIFIIVFIIYQLQLHLTNTRALVIIKGFIILFGFYFISSLFQLKVLEFLLKTIITLSLLAMIILFEPEIKKILEDLGQQQIQPVSFIKTLYDNIKNKKFNIFKKKITHKKRYSDDNIKEILNACSIMSEAKTGALIVIELENILNEYIQTGIAINGDISSQLLINIFEHNTPLHDGAVIIKKNKISAATCYLPLSNNKKINKSLGTRHRAGIGLSEETDAIVIIVSEETGNISFVKDGKINHNINIDVLHNLLNKYQISEKEIVITKKHSLKHNTSKKFISLFIGIFLWFSIINSQDPLDSVKYTIPIELMNEQTLEDVGKTFEVINTQYTDVKVTAPRSILKELNKNDIKAIADFKKLSYTYSLPVEVTIPKLNSNDYKLNINNSTIQLKLDELVNLNTNIQIKTIGTCHKNYHVTNTKTNTNSVSISGAESIIKTIDRIEAKINVTNKKESFTIESELLVYDKNGNIIDKNDYEISQNSIIVNAIIKPKKEIPINIIFENELTENYTLLNKNIDKTSLIISGEQEYLDEINQIDITIDLLKETISDNYIKSINLSEYLNKNIEIIDESDKLNISMEFEIYDTRDYLIPTKNIEILNMNEKYKYTYSNEYITLRFKGNKENIVFNSNDLNITLDVNELNKGEYNLPIYIDNLPSNLKLTSDGIISIIIEEKQ